MRQDILAAFDALDSKAKAAITGLTAPREVKRPFEQLESFLPNQRVLAIAPASDRLGSYRGKGLSGVAAVARSGRLLVLTEASVWAVVPTGRLNGSKPEGVEIRLADVTDVRTREDRRATNWGQKDRILSIDFARGATIETIEHQVTADSAFRVFAERLGQQVNVVQKASPPAPLEAPAAAVSVADEIAKLATLRDSGVLTDAEFADQKARLLQA